MIAFQFIPSTPGVAHRRIDLAGLAGQFGEREEPAPSCNPRQNLVRIAVMILVVLGAIGDTMLVARREAMAACLSAHSSVAPAARAL